ncbi:unnamed protein product [Ixodes persulcatus]
MNNRMTLCTSTKACKHSGLPAILYPKISLASGRRLRLELSAELSSMPRDSPNPPSTARPVPLSEHTSSSFSLRSVAMYRAWIRRTYCPPSAPSRLMPSSASFNFCE